jgi:hypothetical protein
MYLKIYRRQLLAFCRNIYLAVIWAWHSRSEIMLPWECFLQVSKMSTLKYDRVNNLL